MIWCAVNFTLDCSENSWYKWNVRQMCGNIHIHLHRMLISCAHTRSNWFTSYTLSYILKQTQIHAHFRESEREREPTASNNHNIENEVKWGEQYTHTYTHSSKTVRAEKKKKKTIIFMRTKWKVVKTKRQKKAYSISHRSEHHYESNILSKRKLYCVEQDDILLFSSPENHKNHSYNFEGKVKWESWKSDFERNKTQTKWDAYFWII